MSKKKTTLSMIVLVVLCCVSNLFVMNAKAASSLPKGKTFYMIPGGNYNSSNYEYSFETSIPVKMVAVGEGMMQGYIEVESTSNDDGDLFMWEHQIVWNEDLDYEVVLPPGRYILRVHNQTDEKVKIDLSFKKTTAKKFTFCADGKIGANGNLGDMFNISQATYYSSNKNVITINKKGKFEIVNSGTATIKIKNKKFTVILNLEVSEMGLYLLNRIDNKITVGHGQQFSGWFAKSAAVITSSNDNVISVNGEYLIGKNVGTATITLKCGKKTVSKEFEVVENEFSRYKKSDINAKAFEYKDDGSFYVYEKSIKYNKDGSMSISFWVANPSYARYITSLDIKVKYNDIVIAEKEVNDLYDEFNKYSLVEYSFKIPKKDVFYGSGEIDLNSEAYLIDLDCWMTWRKK